jgi:hypothetical protein
MNDEASISLLFTSPYDVAISAAEYMTMLAEMH